MAVHIDIYVKLLIYTGGEGGGLYCSFFRNSLVFCHFIRKTRIFCRLRTSLISLFRLSSALQSLLWTSKVPKKSNMSNKPGFSFFAPTGYLQTPARGCSIFATVKVARLWLCARAADRMSGEWVLSVVAMPASVTGSRSGNSTTSVRRPPIFSTVRRSVERCISVRFSMADTCF